MKIVNSIVIAVLISLFLFQSLNAQTTSQTVVLKEGFNFISLIVIPSITAQQLNNILKLLACNDVKTIGLGRTMTKTQNEMKKNTRTYLKNVMKTF